MTFQRLIGNTYTISVGLAEVAVYKSHGAAILIDSGTKPSPDLLDQLGKEGLRVRAVICTHLHVDHVANNPALVSRYGTEIFASSAELQDAAFWSSQFSYPITEIPREGLLEIDGMPFEIIATPGHSAGHQLVVTPDGVCCLGDSIMTVNRIRTAKIPFMRDITESILSMEKLRQLSYPLYLAAHKGVIPPEELSETIDLNIHKELELYDILRRIISGPIEIDALEIEFMKAAGVSNPATMNRRFMHVTARARILELVNAGEIQMKGTVIAPLVP